MNALFPTGRKEDYYALSTTITIPTGPVVVNDTFCTNTILALDSKVEEEERFSVSLMFESEGPPVLLPNKNATVTIKDGDSKTHFILQTKLHAPT